MAARRCTLCALLVIPRPRRGRGNPSFLDGGTDCHVGPKALLAMTDYGPAFSYGRPCVAARGPMRTEGELPQRGKRGHPGVSAPTRSTEHMERAGLGPAPTVNIGNVVRTDARRTTGERPGRRV